MHKKQKTLQKRLFLSSFCALLITSLLIILFAVILFASNSIEQIGQTRLDVLKQIGSRTDIIKSSMTFVSDLYSQDADVQYYLQKPSLTPMQLNTFSSTFRTKDLQYKDTFKGLYFYFYVMLTGSNGLEYNTMGNPQYDYNIQSTKLWFDDVVNANGEIYWVGSFQDQSNLAADSYIFSAARTIHNPQGDITGILMINATENSLYDSYTNILTNENTIYILNEKGAIVSSSNRNMIGLEYFHINRLDTLFKDDDYIITQKGNETIFLTRHKDANSNWTIIEEVPLRYVFESLYNLLYLLCFLLLLFIPIELFIAYINASRTTKPMRDFRHSMMRVESGDMDVISTATGFVEIDEMSQGFNHMLARICQLLEDVKTNERAKHNAELNFLQAQINPHFMYNTLFSIKCLIAMKKNQEAEFMLSSFIQLLRLTFEQKQTSVMLSEELEYVKTYMHLQQYRYGNDIDITYLYSDEHLHCMIPKLLLQPVIENAIFHGIEPKGSGHITIEVRHTNDVLIISVADDGIGMDQKTIDLIQNGDAPISKKAFNMVGIRNIHQRIQLNYGTEYGLSITSRPSVGTTVTLTLPYID